MYDLELRTESCTNRSTTTFSFDCKTSSTLLSISYISSTNHHVDYTLAVLGRKSRSTTSSNTAKSSFSACNLALFTLLISASVCLVTHQVTRVATAQAATSAIALAKLSRYLGAYLDLKICGPIAPPICP